MAEDKKVIWYRSTSTVSTLGAVILVLLIAVGSFFAGVQYARRHGLVASGRYPAGRMPMMRRFHRMPYRRGTLPNQATQSATPSDSTY